ncbi:MAG: pentapeptide repeat-containing protein, partial [Coprobacillus sp.]|nr:pentapeptide repeat-containing protein [Coprobacillus sp.]
MEVIYIITKNNIYELEDAHLSDDINNDFNQYKHYQNDCLFDNHILNIEFKNCYFEECQLQDISFDNCFFINVTFENCDLSNIKINSSLLRNIQFLNCKLLGTDFSESLFDNAHIKDSVCRFANFSFMKNKKVLFQNCDFTNASIIETQLNKTSFLDCCFSQCEILHSSLYNLDLSSCDLRNIITSPQDITGAIIDEYQDTNQIQET